MTLKLLNPPKAEVRPIKGDLVKVITPYYNLNVGDAGEVKVISNGMRATYCVIQRKSTIYSGRCTALVPITHVEVVRRPVIVKVI